MKNNKFLFLMVVTLSILFIPIASADGNLKINDFTANVTHGSAPLAVRFNVNISGEVTVWKWEFYNQQIDHWTYGGGKGNLITDNHTLKRPGVYNVTLIVVGPDGSDALKKVAYITVYPQGSTPPVAAFSASLTSGTVPLAVTFIDQSTGTPTSWNWDFGDGTHSSVQNPIHKYTKEGKYTVSLTVINSVDSNTSTKSSYINVVTTPVASFSASPITGKAPLKVQFTDKSTHNPTSWKWIFGDGKSSTQKNPLHTYNKAGKYTVSLTVKNAAGTNAKTIASYIIVNTALVKPVAAFSASPSTGKHPLNVKFTDKSTGSPTSWSWNFGDKSTSTVKSPTHKYTKAGKYTVKLTVKNAAGSSTKTMTITVK